MCLWNRKIWVDDSRYQISFELQSPTATNVGNESRKMPGDTLCYFYKFSSTADSRVGFFHNLTGGNGPRNLKTWLQISWFHPFRFPKTTKKQESTNVFRFPWQPVINSIHLSPLVHLKPFINKACHVWARLNTLELNNDYTYSFKLIFQCLKSSPFKWSAVMQWAQSWSRNYAHLRRRYCRTLLY